MTYEILTITNPEVDEAGQKDLSKKIQDLVKKEKGKAVSEKNLGTKKLATPMDKNETGTYLSIVAELKPDSIKGIKKSLKSKAEIINVYIFKAAEPKKDLPAGKAGKAKPKKLSKAHAARQASQSALGGKVSKVAKISKTEKTVKVEKPKSAPKLKKVKPEKKSEITKEIEGEENRLKKLDDKLDEILKE